MLGLSCNVLLSVLFCYVSCVESDSVVDMGRWKRNAKPITCLDKYDVIPGHTMCLDSIVNHPLNASERQLIVDHHNSIRGNVDPPAADMLEMQYFISLELESQIWAEQCKMDHDDNFRRFQPGRFMVGQNIVVSGKPMTWIEVIDLWKDEDKKFKYGVKGNRREEIGHYTQLVWAKTELVGCGMSKCGNKYYYVCNYGPSGNVNSLDHPYTTSTSRSSCDSCPGHCNTTAKLCDCNGKFCLNGATLNLTTCECHCNTHVNYYDPDICELVCEDDVDNVLCGTPPWDQASCSSNMAAIFNCPKLCGLCPYAGANYTEGSVSVKNKNAASRDVISLMTYFLAICCFLML